MLKLDKGIIWTIIVGVIGIIAGYFFFKLSEEGALPVYISENDDAKLIYEAKSPSEDLKLIYKDSIIMSDNVYLNTIYVWNDGKEPITKDNLRKPLAVVLKDGNSILDFKIIKSSPIDIPNFKLEQTNSRTLHINFDFFDPGFAFQAQVIYTGDNNTQLVGNGYVLGSDFKRMKLNKDTGGAIFTVIILFILGTLLFISFIEHFKDLVFKKFSLGKEKKKVIFKWIVTVITFIIGGGLIILCTITVYELIFEYSFLPF